MKPTHNLSIDCKFASLLAVIVSLGLLPTAVYAEPQQGPNGNYYEVVLVPEHITWPQAKLAAEQRRHLGRVGRLATLTSAEEDVFAEYLRQQTPPEGGVNQLWVGGYQVPGSPEATEGWMWINDEGPISGFNGGETYTNWQSYQPDNAWGGEDYLAIGLYGLFGWNDDGSYGDNRFDGTLDGYLVEYETLIVEIDIKPGSGTNPVNLDAPGKLPVAILSTADFDAATLQRSSLTFGRTGIEAHVLSSSLADVNDDKRKDLVCNFSTLETGFICGDTVGILRGRTIGGTPIYGTDVVLTKNCPPYEFSVVALQDVNHLTDLYLTAQVIAPGVNPPLLAKNIVLRSLGISGQQHWTKSFPNTALTPEGTTSSSVNLQFTDAVRHQQVNAQMNVPAGKAGATYVLRQEAVVLARPDLAVERVDAPLAGFVRQLLSIPVYLRELNGDLGATADVQLLEGDTVLDSALNVSIPANSSMAVVFVAKLVEPGQHQLRVVVSNVNPGDYDDSNNEGTATIDISIPSLETVDYYLEYSHDTFDYLYQSSSPYWISSYSEKGITERLFQSLNLPVGLQFPIDSVQFGIGVDGATSIDFEANGIQASYSYGDDYYRYEAGSATLGNGVFLEITSYSGSCCGTGGTYVGVYTYATDYVTFSFYHDLIYGEPQEYTGGETLGTLFNATQQVDTNFVVTDEGAAYGGKASVLLQSEPYNYSWNDVYDYGDGIIYRYEGYQRGTVIRGSSSGQTSP